MSAEEQKALLKRAVQAFNHREDRTMYLAFYDANCVLHGFPPGLPPGIEGVKRFYEGIWTAFADGQLTIEDAIAEGDQLACRFTFRATHQGEFMGIPPTGRPVTLGGITILRIADGKIVERWNQADMLGLLQQLGAIPAPGEATRAA